MKLNRITAALIVAAATAGTASMIAQAAPAVTSTATTPDVAAATDSGPTASTPANRHWHHRQGGLLVGTTLRAVHQLDLSSEQQQQIKGILTTARSQHQAAAAIDIAALGNPADPNYAAALESAKTQAAAHLQRESELQAQIYNVLTAGQKAKLPQVLADMKAKAQQRRAAWRARATRAAPSDAKGSEAGSGN